MSLSRETFRFIIRPNYRRKHNRHVFCKIRLVRVRKMHHNVLLEMQNTGWIRPVFSKCESSRVKCTYQIPYRCPFFFSLRLATLRCVYACKHPPRHGLSRIARTNCDLSRDALNFSNKDNKAMWKTVGLKRTLNFRLRAVLRKQT